MVAAVTAVVVVYGAVSLRNRQEVKWAALTEEMREDERLMTTISALADNPLPAFCSEISGESYPNFDEEFVDFVVPYTEADLVSGGGGGVRC
jgi:hypothetical protein